jgi:hypothetical protein
MEAEFTILFWSCYKALLPHPAKRHITTSLCTLPSLFCKPQNERARVGGRGGGESCYPKMLLCRHNQHEKSICTLLQICLHTWLNESWCQMGRHQAKGDCRLILRLIKNTFGKKCGASNRPSGNGYCGNRIHNLIALMLQMPFIRTHFMSCRERGRHSFHCQTDNGGKRMLDTGKKSNQYWHAEQREREREWHTMREKMCSIMFAASGNSQCQAR